MINHSDNENRYRERHIQNLNLHIYTFDVGLPDTL